MHARAFYRDVAAAREVWTIRDDAGFPAPIASGGQRAMPFWSSERRALRVIRQVEAYKGFVPVRIEWEAFRDRWLPGLEKDGLRVGVNWTEPKATGYDIDPRDLEANVEAASKAHEGRQ
jgi:hypothetical protein